MPRPKGYKLSEETKRKISISQSGKTGNKNTFFGHKHTKETKRRMSEKLKQIYIIKKQNMGIYDWNGVSTTPTYHKIVFENFKLDKICSICGTIKDICVHHIDENRNNNSKENLLVVCRGCHTSLHAKNNKLWVKHMNK